MNVKGLPQAIAREAVIVLGGALIAAAVLSAFPKLKAWVKENLY